MSFTRAYSISAAPERLALHKRKRTGEVSFTVTNRTDRALRTEVRPCALEGAADNWFSLGSDANVREIGAGESTQCTVQVKVVGTVDPGDYRFRLDANSVHQPEEVFTEGPVVVVSVPPAASDDNGFEFRWWMAVAAVAVVLVIAGLITWSRSGGEPVSVPALVDLPRAEAVEEIEALGLAVGEIERRSIWAVQDRVLEQSPEPEATVSEGDRIDLVVANSEFTFTSERLLIPDDDEEERTTVRGDYRVKLLQSEESDTRLGEFVLEEVAASSEESIDNEMIEALIDAPGYVPVGAIEDIDLSKMWETYARMARDFEEEMAEMPDDPGEEAMAALGKSVMIMIVTTQIVFDLKTILQTVPIEREDDFEGLELQEGTELLAAFRVEGTPTLSNGGSIRVFDVLRRAESDEDFERVGTASYDVADGLLLALDVSYRLDQRNSFYRLSITREDD